MFARILPAVLLLSTGCATTGATFGSGVGDAFPKQPPYYAGARVVPPAAAGARIGILPIQYQPGASQPAMFDPRWGPDTPIAKLLLEMNTYLDSLRTASGDVTIRLIDGSRVSAVAPTSLGIPPDVRFGCRTEGNLPGEDCIARGDSALGRGDQRMHLSVGRPSAAWIEWAGTTMAANNVSTALVFTLELGNYLPKQRGILGRKQVELGTNNTVELPWLTSLETPVAVVQITGALVGRDGKAIRIGAEGLYAKRTRLLVSAVGAEELLRDDDLTEIRTRRRDELPGQPLAWKVALQQLTAQLTK